MWGPHVQQSNVNNDQCMERLYHHEVVSIMLSLILNILVIDPIVTQQSYFIAVPYCSGISVVVKHLLTVRRNKLMKNERDSQVAPSV